MSAFPIYRKYPNDSSFFKIDAADSFEELQIVGSRCLIHRFKATILPDRYLLQDMIEMLDGRWLLCDAETYESARQNCRRE